MTLLVTGGAGFVGAHFVRAAKEAGKTIVVLDDLSGGGRGPLPPDVPLIQGDIGDRAAVAAVLRDSHIDEIAHFAGKIQVGESVIRPELYFDVNLVRSIALIEVAVEAGVSRFIFSSSAAVYGAPDKVPIPEAACAAPLNPYGATKLAVEHVLRAFSVSRGLKFAALRYFNAAGAHPDGSIREAHEPETHLCPLIIDAGLGLRPPITIFGDDYPTPDGTCTRDYIHVNDLASAHLAALSLLERGVDVGAVNLGTGQGVSVREVLGAASRLLGRPIPHKVGPRRAGDPPVLVADPSFGGRLLGFSPARSSIETILEDTLRSRVPPALH